MLAIKITRQNIYNEEFQPINPAQFPNTSIMFRYIINSRDDDSDDEDVDEVFDHDSDQDTYHDSDEDADDTNSSNGTQVEDIEMNTLLSRRIVFDSDDDDNQTLENGEIIQTVETIDIGSEEK